MLIGKVELLQWIAFVAPCEESALQWPYMFNPELFEFQRQTGTAGFARSSAVQDDVAIAGNLSGTLQQFVWIKPDSGWD